MRDGLEFSPGELDALELRLDTLRRLMRKYGGSEEELIAFREKCQSELDEIEFASEKLEKLEKELEELKLNAVDKANILSQRRRAASKPLRAHQIRLAGLNMAGVRFKVEFDGVNNEFG